MALLAMASPQRPIVDADAGEPVARVVCPRHDAAQMRHGRVDTRPFQIGGLERNPPALAQNRRFQFMRGVEIPP